MIHADRSFLAWARYARPSRLQLRAFVGAVLLTGCATKWHGFYEVRSGTPPQPLLIEALSLARDEGKTIAVAVDAGCGQGIETLEMLRQGIEVHAFDIQPEAIERLRAATPPELSARLHSEVASFSVAALPAAVDLVFAGNSLPFAIPAEFPAAWTHLTGAIAPGGFFAGQLFGKRDDWATLPDRTHHERAEVEALLAAADLQPVILREVERDEELPTGTMKHWHVFEILARRRSAAAAAGER